MSNEGKPPPVAHDPAPPGWRLMRTAVLAGLVFASVFLYHHNFFYRHGGYLLDAGSHAYLFYRNGVAPLWHPLLTTEHFGRVFFQYHLSPATALFSLASYLAPMGRLDWFAFCQGVFYAMIACAMCSLADRFTGDRRSGAWIAIAGLLGMIYTLNGFTISCLGYPHLEIAIVAFGLCFLASLLRRRMAPAWLFFALACCVREDAGFHLSLVLGALWAATFAEKHLAPLRRDFLLFAGVAFSASVVLLVAQRVFFPHPAAGPSALQFAFFDGKPAAITWGLVGERLASLPRTALSLILAVAAGVVCAIVTRKYVLLLCWVVNLPWFALNLVAADPSRHALGIYHVFPFLFAVAWPLMVLPPLAGGEPRARLAGWLAAVLLPAAASTVGQWMAMPGMFDDVVAGLVHFRFQKEAPFDALGRSLQDEPHLYGRVAMDDAAGCVYLDFLQRSHIDYDKNTYDSLVFFKDTMFTAQMLRLALRDRLDHCARLAGTNLLLVSNRDTPEEIDGKPLLKPASLWLELEKFLPSAAVRLPDGAIAQSAAGACILGYGPYVTLPPGKYRVAFQIDGATGADRQAAAANSGLAPVAKLAVCHSGGTVSVAAAELNGAALPATATLSFEVSPADQGRSYEFIVTSPGRARLAIKAISLERE